MDGMILSEVFFFKKKKKLNKKTIQKLFLIKSQYQATISIQHIFCIVCIPLKMGSKKSVIFPIKK